MLSAVDISTWYWRDLRSLYPRSPRCWSYSWNFKCYGYGEYYQKQDSQALWTEEASFIVYVVLIFKIEYVTVICNLLSLFFCILLVTGSLGFLFPSRPYLVLLHLEFAGYQICCACPSHLIWSFGWAVQVCPCNSLTRSDWHRKDGEWNTSTRNCTIEGCSYYHLFSAFNP